MPSCAVSTGAAHWSLAHLVDQSPGQCRLCVYGVGGKGERSASLPSDATCDADRSTGTRDESEVHLWEAEASAMVCDDLACERGHFDASTQGHAMDFGAQPISKAVNQPGRALG